MTAFPDLHPDCVPSLFDSPLPLHMPPPQGIPPSMRSEQQHLQALSLLVLYEREEPPSLYLSAGDPALDVLGVCTSPEPSGLHMPLAGQVTDVLLG